MISITCKSNHISFLKKSLQKLAFTQDEQGNLDLTIGKAYTVYGYKQNKYGGFVLVLTDSIHTSTPWWMPTDLFESVPKSLPTSWEHREFGHLIRTHIWAPAIYFSGMEEVEDGTTKGIDIFAKMKE